MSTIKFGADELGTVAAVAAVEAAETAHFESFFASLECELIDRSVFKTRAEARIAVFEYIESFYNPYRRHSALGQLSPVNFEQRAQLAQAA